MSAQPATTASPPPRAAVLAHTARARSRVTLGLIGGAVALLLGAWIVATSPFQAPDEASHYLRALTIANGHLLGPRTPYPPTLGLSPSQLAFVQGDTRAVRVPARLSPPNVRCIDGRPDSGPGSCPEATPTGDYYPPAFLLPALALKVSPDASTALWLGRLASALPCLALIVAAFALLWDADGWSILGPLLAVSPMVLFVGSIINPSGLEIAASLAFAAATLRVARAPEQVPRWVWAALIISGAVTIMSWQVGPAFALADVALGLALSGREGVRALGGGSRRAVMLAALALLIACGLWLWYSNVSGVSHTSFSVHPILFGLQQGLAQMPFVLKDAVGTFGALTVHLPTWAYWAWWLAVVALVALAAWLGSWRERAVIVAVAIVALAFTVLSYAWVQRHSGFGMQGRYVLGLLVLLPLTAGEVVRRHRRRLLARPLAQRALPVAIGLIAAFQLYAWWLAARTAAGAPRTLRFWAHATWSPPLGWIPWLLAAALGACALAALGAVEAVGGSPRADPLALTRAGSRP